MAQALRPHGGARQDLRLDRREGGIRVQRCQWRRLGARLARYAAEPVMEDLRPDRLALGHPGIEGLQEINVRIILACRRNAEQRMRVRNETVAIGQLVRREGLCQVIGFRPDKQERGGQLLQRPATLHGLAPEPVEPLLVKIGRREVRIGLRQEAPRPEIERLAGNVEIVGIHDAMNKTRRHPLADHPAGGGGDTFEQLAGLCRHVRVFCLRMELCHAIVDQLRHGVPLFQIGKPLETAEADMAVRQARKDGGARRRRLVIAGKLFAGLDQGERFRRVDAERLEIGRGEDFPHAAFQRQPPVALPAPRRLAGAFGAKVQQPALPVTQLRKQEAAAIAKLRIVGAELVAVIAQRERLFQVSRQRLEPAEMGDLPGHVQIAKPDLPCPASIPEADLVFGKISRRNRIRKEPGKLQDRGRQGHSPV